MCRRGDCSAQHCLAKLLRHCGSSAQAPLDGGRTEQAGTLPVQPWPHMKPCTRCLMQVDAMQPCTPHLQDLVPHAAQQQLDAAQQLQEGWPPPRGQRVLHHAHPPAEGMHLGVILVDARTGQQPGHRTCSWSREAQRVIFETDGKHRDITQPRTRHSAAWKPTSEAPHRGCCPCLRRTCLGHEVLVASLGRPKAVSNGLEHGVMRYACPPCLRGHCLSPSTVDLDNQVRHLLQTAWRGQSSKLLDEFHLEQVT